SNSPGPAGTTSTTSTVLTTTSTSTTTTTSTTTLKDDKSDTFHAVVQGNVGGFHPSYPLTVVKSPKSATDPTECVIFNETTFDPVTGAVTGFVLRCADYQV